MDSQGELKVAGGEQAERERRSGHCSVLLYKNRAEQGRGKRPVRAEFQLLRVLAVVAATI